MTVDPHRFNRKVCSWEYCSKCGLVALKNEPTLRAMNLGCNWAAILRGRKS